MKPLEPPDSLHLRAAQGWCELHAFSEADAELDNIAASLRAHPLVLEVRWQPKEQEPRKAALSLMPTFFVNFACLPMRRGSKR